MSETLIDFAQDIFKKINDNITFIMVFTAIMLVIRFVFIAFGFEIMTLLIAGLLFMWSFFIDLKRSKVKKAKRE